MTETGKEVAMESNSMIRRLAVQDPGKAAAEIISLLGRLRESKEGRERDREQFRQGVAAWQKCIAEAKEREARMRDTLKQAIKLIELMKPHDAVWNEGDEGDLSRFREAAKEPEEKPKKCVGHPVGEMCICFGEPREPTCGSV